MNPTSQDIKDMLEAQSSLDLTFNTNLFMNKEPARPNNAVTIFDTGGLKPQLNFNKNEKYQKPTVQIRVRNNSYQTGWALINDIRDILHGRGHEVWDGTTYELIQCRTEPAFLGQDENNRPWFTANFLIQRR